MDIVILMEAVTWGAGQWNNKFGDWTIAVRRAVRVHPERARLAEWLNTKQKLAIEIIFWLRARHDANLDNLFATIFNAVVEGVLVTRHNRQKEELI